MLPISSQVGKKGLQEFGCFPGDPRKQGFGGFSEKQEFGGFQKISPSI